MNYYTVDILTPYSVIADNIPAESLLIPTARGQINVLPEHTHLISQLGPGHLVVFGGADDPTRFFNLTVGICKVLKNKITILTQVAEESKVIDIERAKISLENALSRLKEGNLTDDEFDKFQRKVERSRLRIQLGQDSTGSSKKN